jgi:hypothetical protein
MSITHHTIPEHNLNILLHKGTTPDDEFLAFYKQLYQSNIVDPAKNMLVDLRKTDSSQRSADVLAKFADFARACNKNWTKCSKVAVVAPSDSSFSLASMYAYFTHPMLWNFLVFRDMDIALAWLGVPEDLAIGCEEEI